MPKLIAQRAQVLFNQVGVKPVVPGRHRCVRGENHFSGNLARSGVEIQAFFNHAIANGLEDREAAVSLIQMKNSGRDAHGFESAKAADAEQQLLTNAGSSVAAIQARGKFTVFRRIPGNVRVEQQQIATSHFHAPDLGTNRTAACLNLHHHRLAVFNRWPVAWAADRQVGLQGYSSRCQPLWSSRCKKYPCP